MPSVQRVLAGAGREPFWCEQSSTGERKRNHLSRGITSTQGRRRAGWISTRQETIVETSPIASPDPALLWGGQNEPVREAATTPLARIVRRRRPGRATERLGSPPAPGRL